MVVRSTAWVKTAGTGLEFVDLEIDEGRMTAAGVAIGSDPLPYRLDYSFATRSRFIS